MVAARTAAKGLSTEDLEQIRDTLAAGRKPKVVFTEQAGQIVGQLGQIVALTDPELSDEWVVVRFGRDELPFSPADLAIAPKAAPAKRAVPAPREETPVPALSTSTAAPDTEASPGSSPTAAPAVAAAGAGSSDAAGSGPTDSGPDAAATETPPADSPAASTDAKPSSSSRPPAKKAAAKQPKAPAGLTVTLAYADGEWTVAANQGAKSLAKPYVIKAGEALKMVAMLDVPGVHEAVEEIVTAARAEAETQAERLRAELAEIEARLAELREAE